MLVLDDVIHNHSPSPFSHFGIGVSKVHQADFAADVRGGNRGLVLVDHQPLGLRSIFSLQTLAQLGLRVLAVEHAAAIAQLHKCETLIRHVFHPRFRC